MTTQTLLAFDEAAVAPRTSAAPRTLEERIAQSAWEAFETQLTRDGYAVLPQLLTATQCREMASCFPQENLFRSRIVMERYAFGRGVYKYFQYPLPNLVGRLRESLYPHLAPIANRWHAAMRIEERFPPRMPSSAPSATVPASSDPRRCCCATRPATTAACIRTCTASMCFRCRRCSCWISRAGISKEASCC